MSANLNWIGNKTYQAYTEPWIIPRVFLFYTTWMTKMFELLLYLTIKKKIFELFLYLTIKKKMFELLQIRIDKWSNYCFRSEHGTCSNDLNISTDTAAISWK